MKDKKKRIRITVLKPGCNGLAPRKRSDWTCVYADPVYPELLAIADGNDDAVRNAVRLAAKRSVERPGRTWTDVCLTGARVLLKQAKAAAEAKAKALAAANNSAWDGVQ